MAKSKLITIIGLLLFCVVIFLPPIIHGYVYPNVGDDSAVHLMALDLLQTGDKVGVGYLGLILLGVPILWISNLANISIDPLFLWFSYVALALVGITLYFVMSRLVNKQAGWFALVLTIFCAQGILSQFYFGQIFNLINIGIILPWLLFFIVRYLIDKRVYQLVLVIVFVGLFGSFHSSGIYLPFVAGFAVVSYVIYSLVRKQKMQLQGIILGISIIVVSIISALLIDPYALMGRAGIGKFLEGFERIPSRMAVPMANYMLSIVSLTILAILAFACVFCKDILHDVYDRVKALSFILLCIAVLLAIVTFTKLSFDPWRTALDLATILALLAAISIGLFLGQQKNKLVMIILIGLVSFGLFHNVPTWFGYNSAIRPVDKQAIAYVNSLDYESYACSGEVAPWIYSRFIKAEHRIQEQRYLDVFLGSNCVVLKSDSDLIIVRSEPMTPRSDKKNIWYGHHGIMPNESFEVTYISDDCWEAYMEVVPNESFELTRVFSDDEVEVCIYERKQ